MTQKLRHSMLFAGVLLFVALGTLLAYQGDGATDIDEAARLYHAQEWEEAAEAYLSLAGVHPDSAFVWFRLGMIYQHQGQLRKSVAAFERSGESANFADPNVVKALTFIYIKMDDTENALKWLERFVDGGLRPEPMRSRPEFAPLRDEPRFKALMREAEKNNRKCDSPEHRQFDFWLGKWDVANHHGVGDATDDITESLDGCMIEESYSGFRGNHGRSFSSYDIKAGIWKQVWLNNDGAHLEFSGGLVDGSMRLVSNATITSWDGRIVLNRLTWTPRDDGSVHQVFDNSDNGGKDWAVQFELTYTPQKR